jgi:hypothetical protein
VRVFENRVLWRMFGLTKEEVTGECRELHEEERNDTYSSPNIIWLIESRRMGWVWNGARKEERRDSYRV